MLFICLAIHTGKFIYSHFGCRAAFPAWTVIIPFQQWWGGRKHWAGDWESEFSCLSWCSVWLQAGHFTSMSSFHCYLLWHALKQGLPLSLRACEALGVVSPDGSSDLVRGAWGHCVGVSVLLNVHVAHRRLNRWGRGSNRNGSIQHPQV